MKTSIFNYGGVYVASSLFLVLTALKLTGVVSWSWWAISSPLWGMAIFDAVIIVLGIWAFWSDDRNNLRKASHFGT